MKKALLLLGMIAAGAASGGVVAWSILSPAEKNGTHVVTPQSGAVSDDPFSQAGTHFTSYQAEQYPDLTYAAENAVKAGVNIEVVQESEVPERQYDPFFEFFGIPQQGRRGPSTQERRGGGSGVIISADGYIVTNNHVVDEATRLRVKLSDGRTFDAKVIGTDPTTDVALLKIEAENLPVIPVGDSDALKVGEWVLAVGNPFGFTSTVTTGIVSAKARSVGLAAMGRPMGIESYIQTDAAVNPGNSGGALVNIKGELVGINTAVHARGEGIGFAIPIDTAKPIIDELIEKGYVSGRPAIGIDGETLPATYRIYYRLPQGIYVTRVYRNSDAAAKGISEGDIITAINGVSVTTMEQLNRVKNQFTAGQTITLTIYHGGVSSDVEIILMDRANA